MSAIAHCILHIGAEKTGTTSIQKHFGRHADALRRRGYWYPASLAEPGSFVHTRLSDIGRNRKPDSAAKFGQAFQRELDEAARAGAHTAIISSEFLHSTVRKAFGVRRIRDFLEPFFGDTRIVYYARRQDNMLVSMHSTAVRGGFTSSASALAVYQGKGHYYFDHAAVCELWAETFGRENLLCRVYERALLTNGDIVDDFAAAIGLALEDGEAKPTANESISFEAMHVLLLLNGSKHKDNTELRRKLVAQGRRRGGERIPMLTRAEAQEFLARFEDSNRNFFERYVDPRHARGFEPGFEGFPEEVPDPPPARKIVDFIFGRNE